MDAADLSPVPEAQRTQPTFDLFLIFIAANVVATTLQTGAVLGSRYGGNIALGLTVVGAAFGALLVALLAPVGSRWGVPSMIAARLPLGYRGAQLVSLVLFITNFAWIALNNQIAASACAAVLGGPSTLILWSAALGVASTAVVAAGPRAVGFADRFAVPVMAIAGAALTYSAVTLARPAPSASPSSADLVWGLDVVIGYQVSWLLMFADYSRYTRSAARAGIAVWAGLALPAFWLMPLGLTLAQIAGSDDPGRMLASLGQGWWTAVLITLASVTTNFVNIYMSSLAWRTIASRSTGAGTVWTIGLIGTAIGLLSTGLLAQFGSLMTLLGSILVPVGGVFLAHFVVLKKPIDIAKVYDTTALEAVNIAGIVAWIAGDIVYRVAAPIGATLPALASSMIVYLVLHSFNIAVTRVKP
ncbi:MAG: cytosine permease [Cyanobacteria bacterium]|nr:cytosine permease [Cyanobacteriota bacterium]